MRERETKTRGRPNRLPLLRSRGQACPDPLRDANAFLLCHHRDNGDYGIPEDVAGVEILLGETVVADAVAGESLRVQ